MQPYLDTVYDLLTRSAAQEKTNSFSPFISLYLKVLGVYMVFYTHRIERSVVTTAVSIDML